MASTKTKTVLQTLSNLLLIAISLWCSVIFFDIASAYSAENPSKPVAALGLYMVAVGFAVSIPVLIAMNTTGQWYSLRRYQPELILDGEDFSWEITGRNLLPVSVTGGLLLLGFALNHVFDRESVGWLTSDRVLVFVLTVLAVIMVSSSHVTVVKRGDVVQVQYEFLLFRSTHQSIRSITEQSVKTRYVSLPLLPAYHQWQLRGNAYTEASFMDRTVSERRSSKITIMLPFFRNVTLEQFAEIASTITEGDKVKRD